MPYNIGDKVRLKSNNDQTGTVSRLNPLSSQGSIVVTWDEGPIFAEGKQIAYFGANVSANIEPLPI